MLLRPSAPQAVTATVRAAPGSQLHVTVADPLGIGGQDDRLVQER